MEVAKTLEKAYRHSAFSSVADDRKVGLGHGNLAAMLLSDDQNVLHSLQDTIFAAAEGAIGVHVQLTAHAKPLVNSQRSWKRRAQIISRINGLPMFRHSLTISQEN